MTIRLSLNTLPELPHQVEIPDYNRSDLRAGILHIGVGNFHRAHQAVYLDRLFSEGMDHDWAIVGAGVKSFDADRREKLKAQDWLTTVVELDPESLSARVTGAMVDFLPVDAEAIIAAMTNPAIRIVSTTVTEGGYYTDANDRFDADHEDVAHDAQADVPRSVFGIIVAGLKARKAAGHAPFTVMSCDNLPSNGDVARQAVMGFAAAMDPEAAKWIEAEVAFPNGMVDCITPATSAREIEMVRDSFNIEDTVPVICEPFHQWVLEDNFPSGRPALEKVGVEFVEDVHAFELMKLRILNGGHASIAYVGSLLGHTYAHEAMQDEDIAAWYRALAREEIIPTLKPIPGVDYDAYLETCVGRFANPRIGDTLARLCLDGSNRQPKFILPTVRDRLAAGASVDGLALEVAIWCHYCATAEARGIKIDDDRAESLRKAATEAQDRPQAFLELREVFSDLADAAPFVEAFGRAVTALKDGDVRGVIRDFA